MATCITEKYKDKEHICVKFYKLCELVKVLYVAIELYQVLV